MIVPIPWLKEFLPTLSLNSAELCNHLNLIGHESVVIDDQTLDVSITANRGDCTSIYGLARDVAGALSIELVEIDELKPQVSLDSFKVDISTDLKSEIYGYELIKIKDIQKLKSTDDMLAKLNHLGLTTKGAIVDLTNIISHEIGLPMHSFDYDKISSGLSLKRIVNNQLITLLDGSVKDLIKGTLVQSSDNQLVDLIGVMGAKNSSVNSSTKNVLLQLAVFSPKSVRFNSRSTGIHSPASWRFERGVDPGIHELALSRIHHYLPELTNLSELVFQYQKESLTKTVKFNRKKIELLLGIKLTPNLLLKLTQIGLKINGSTVIIPSWRYDVSNWQDIADEIIRLDQFKSLLEKQLSKMEVGSDQYTNLKKIKNFLTQFGFTETINYSISHENSPLQLREFVGHGRYLRSNLKVGLLRTISHNPFVNRLKLYEVGRVFSPKEVLKIGLITAGLNHREISLIESQLSELFRTNINFSVVDRDELNRLSVKNKKVTFTEVEINKINIDKNSTEINHFSRPPIRKYRAVSKFPPIIRDISLLLDESTDLTTITDIIKTMNDCFIVELSDIYCDEKLPNNHCVYTFKIIFQNVSQTLNSEDVSQAVDEGLRELAKHVQFQLR